MVVWERLREMSALPLCLSLLQFHQSPNSVHSTPTRDIPTPTQSRLLFATPSRFTNGSPSASSNLMASFDGPDHALSPSPLNSPGHDVFSNDFGFKYHDDGAGATAASPSTPHRRERLKSHQIPFNPTPSKLAAIEAFDREHPDGLGLSEAEIDSLLDSSH